ncbi:MAG: cysteine hydrolase [Chloroflexia bacterium]|nr:cysteine hydrolase [Chloroflexia bacterium]
MTTDYTPPFVREWLATIRPASFEEAIPEPAAAAIFSADMINGFLHFGPLASDRVKALAEPVTSLFERAWAHGVRNFVLCQDTHHPETPEFEAYPPHCLADSPESETIPELASLPFAGAFTIIEKNSLSPSIGTALDDWLAKHPEVTTAIVVGDCTDLCTYQLAMYLRMRANALNMAGYTVIVPTNAVATFDIPHTDAESASNAHPAEFFHEVFLYHMAQNGIEVVTSIS